MKLRRSTAALLLVITLLANACGGSGTNGSAAVLTVYSPSGLGKWYQSRFEKFTSDTGIPVRLFEAGSGEVVSRVNSPAVWQQLDGGQSVAPADLLITLPPFIQRAQKAGLLQPGGVDTAGLPAEFVGPSGVYVPIVKTALCFIANPDLTPLPRTWDDLLRPELKGKLQYSTPGQAGDGTAVLLLLQHLMGKQGALDYLAKLEANNVGPSTSTDTLQTKVDSGELSVANGDVQMNLASINNDGSTFTIFFPAMPGGKATTISLAYVAGVTATSQRPEQAKRLLAYLLSDESQKTVAPEAFGIPVRDWIAQEAARDTGRLVPGRLLEEVQVWTPDWNNVLNELEGDIADYQKAISS